MIAVIADIAVIARDRGDRKTEAQIAVIAWERLGPPSDRLGMFFGISLGMFGPNSFRSWDGYGGGEGGTWIAEIAVIGKPGPFSRRFAQRNARSRRAKSQGSRELWFSRSPDRLITRSPDLVKWAVCSRRFAHPSHAAVMLTWTALDPSSHNLRRISP